MRVLPLVMGIPFSMIFFGDFNGDTVHLAFAKSMALLIDPRSAAILALTLLGSALIILRFLHPVILFNLCCQLSRPVSREEAEQVIQRFNHLHFVTILISVVGFALGDLQAVFFNKAEMLTGFPAVFIGFNALSKGVLVGVILSFNLENILFKAKQRALALYSDIKLQKTSLYRKIFMIIGAIVFFFVLQLLSTTAHFFGAGSRLPLPVNFGSDLSTFFQQSIQRQSLQGSLGVFLVKITLYLFYVLELMYQIKGLIKQPLKTIGERLSSLTSGSPQDSQPIDILYNDEFAEVYSQLNTLIKQQRRDLECSSVRLEKIVEQAADPIISFDGTGTIMVYNPAAEHFFGYTAAEIKGKVLTSLIELTAGEMAACDGCSPEEAVIEHLYGHQNGIKRFTGLHKDGTRKIFESNVSKTDSNGTTVYTAIIRDIAQQLEAETLLTNAKNAAESANRLKSEFLANMSHELRTPLNAVLGFTQLLSTDKNLTEGQLEKINIVSRSGEHLLSLINDILDISKIEAGKIELHETVFSLTQFVEDIREMFSLRCKKNGLSLYVEFSGDLPAAVKGDLGKLRQVLINLVGNAIKFTREGGVGILVGMDKGEIRFAVTDSGKGIPADELELIMKPFTQSSITDNEGGTGLGLAISSRFIQMMGGQLSVHSEVGKGSTFSFAVPLRESAELPTPQQTDATPLAVKKGSEVTALIVDDKELNRLVLKEMLEAAGFITVEAENGAVAVERVRECNPRIVFMDIKMPVMDGYEALRRIKAEQSGSAIAVFALTASAFINDEQKILAFGFDGFLAKPFKRSALFQLIKERAGVELEYESVSERTASEIPDADSIDYSAAAANLGQETLEELADAVQINDFTGIQLIAEERIAGRESLGALAALLRYAAGNFDEETLSRVILNLEKALP